MKRLHLANTPFSPVSCFRCLAINVTGYSQALAYSLILSHITFIPYVQAGPTGGNIVGGAGNINQSGLNTIINQTTGTMAINWDTFNINTNERVQYLQPDISSISLNRILDHNGSKILGNIDANGKIILVNPNGIFFGANSQINVGGLVASGLSISPTDFMNGSYIFNEVLGSNGSVINKGLINAATGGSVTLLGKQVKNEGVISAKLGRVNMAAGRQAALIFNNEGTIGVKITKEILQDELGIDPALLNSGEINAEGGQVLLTASVSRDVFSQAVNSGALTQATSVVVNADGSMSLKKGADVVNSGAINVTSTAIESGAGDVVVIGENITHTGIINANSETGRAGNIELHANDKVELQNTATLVARAENSGSGGNVKVLGSKVGLLDNSVVDVSGTNGGGEALIGGDRQGQNKNIRNAEFLYVGENTKVYADAIDNGNGGKIITYADNTARIYGDLFARGGKLSGNGGFIETSGKLGFEILNAPDTSSANGEGGLWLIDPRDITISNGDGTGTTGITPSGNTIYTSTGSPAVLETGTLLTGLGNGSVSIVTGTGTSGNGDITFDANLDYNGQGTGKTLTLSAFNEINFSNGASIFDSVAGADTLNVVLQANTGGNSNNGTGNIGFGTNTSINTGGGSFTASGVGFNSGTATINVGVGSINLDGMLGDVTLGNLTASGTIASNLNIQNASNIFQQSGSTIIVGRDTFLGNSSTTTVSLNQGSNSFGRNIVVKADTATITGIGRIRLDSGTNITTALNLTSTDGGDLASTNAGTITVTNGSNNATATFNTTGDVDFNNNNNFDRVNILSARDVTLRDTSGNIALSANNGANSGGLTGKLIVNATNGNIIDYGEINVGGTTDLTVGDNRSIILDETLNTLTGLITVSAGAGNSFNNLTLTNTSGINLNSVSVNNDLTLTADAINLGRTAGITSASNLVINSTSTAIGLIAITQNMAATNAINISDTSTLNVAGTLQAIVLNNVANDFSVVNASASTVNLSDINAISLDTINATDLTINAAIAGTGGLATDVITNTTSTSTVSVSGTTSLTARNTTNNNIFSINLNSDNNNFNNVTLVDAFNVVLTDNADAINLSSTNRINTLDVTSTGTLTTGSTIGNVGTSGVSVSGVANFKVADNQSINLNGSNSFLSNPVFSSATPDNINNLIVTDTTDFTLQDDLITQGNLNITASNIVLRNTTVGDGLTLTATAVDATPTLIGTITQLASPATTLTVGGLSTLDARSITLNQADNDFQGNVVVNNSLAAVNLRDSAGGIVLGDTNSAFVSNSLTVNSTGNISQANSISAGITSLNAGTADVLLNTSNTNNFSNSIYIVNANDAFINDTTATFINAASVANDLTLNTGGTLTLGDSGQTVSVGNDFIASSAGAISQTDTSSTLTVTGNTQLTARNASAVNQNITLKNVTNQFSDINIISAANVDLWDSTGSLSLQGNVRGFLNVRANGTNTSGFVITNPAALNVDGLATFTVVAGESINLGDAGNTFLSNPVFSTVIAGGRINNLIISDDTAMAFQNNLNLDGNLTVNASDITFNNTQLFSGSLVATSSTGQIQQVGNSTLTVNGTATLDGGTGGINLDSANDFQNTVTLNTNSPDTINQPSNVIIRDANTLDIGTSNIAGSLTVTANTVTQTNDGIDANGDGISVANASSFTIADNSSITLDNIDNQFNAVSFLASTAGAILNNVTISNSGALDLQNIQSNNLTATSLGNITQNNLNSTGALIINNLMQLTGNIITLNNSANNFNDVTILSGSSVSITDNNALNFIGESTITDSLTLSVLNGDISDDATGALLVTNNTFLTTSNGNIALGSGLHDFNSVQLMSAGDATLTDLNSIDIRSSVINGDLSIAADTSMGGIDNNIINTSGNIQVNGESRFISSAGADILLARTGSNHRFFDGISASGVADTRLNNVQINNSGDTRLQDINATNLSLISGGDIVDVGAINVSDLTDLSTTADINLNETLSNNSLNRITVNNANNVNINSTTAVTLESFAQVGGLNISANGITTNSNLVADVELNLNAGTGSLNINNDLTVNNSNFIVGDVDDRFVILAAEQDIIQAANTTITGSYISLNSDAGVINQNGNIIQNQINNAQGSLNEVVITAQSIVMGGAASTQADSIITNSTGDQSISSLSAALVSLSSSNGAIIDANAEATNINALNLTINADSGIGQSIDQGNVVNNAIETEVVELDITNNGAIIDTVTDGNGNIIDIRSAINISNTGDVLVSNLINTGDINFNNTTNITVDKIDAGFSVGRVTMNTDNGSVFGIDRGIGNGFLNIADITADTGIFSANGNFGTFDRPIVLKIRSEFVLSSIISSTFFPDGKPPIYVDTSDISFDIFDSINSVSGQQLIEVESVADINKAIFTDLQNYSSQEIAIRLPRGQIFEDELDLYDQ